MKTVWLLDVDGVINARRPQWDCGSTEGKATAGARTYTLRWAPDLISWIRELHTEGLVEVRWCTTWCPYADEMEKLFDLPPLVRAWEDEIRGTACGMAKLAAARQVLADGHRLVWTDDTEAPDSMAPLEADLYDELTAGGRALLIQPDGWYGLFPADMDAIEAFARDGAS